MDNTQGWQRYGEKGTQGISGTCVASKQPLRRNVQKVLARKSLGKIHCSSLTPSFCLPPRSLTKRIPRREFFALDQSSVAFSMLQIQET